jgi:hypothetical protein
MTMPVGGGTMAPDGTMVHSQMSGNGIRNDIRTVLPHSVTASQLREPEPVAIVPARITRSKPSGAL